MIPMIPVAVHFVQLQDQMVILKMSFNYCQEMMLEKLFDKNAHALHYVLLSLRSSDVITSVQYS